MFKSRLCVFTLAPVMIAASVVHTASPARGADVEITPDVVYGHKFGLALTFDVFRPQGKANGAGVMFMVSGGWYSRWSPPENLKSLFQPLTDKGYTVFAVRHGSSPRFSIPEAVADVRLGVRFIRQNSEKYGVDPKRLGVFGMSAGGHLSLMLGTTADKGDEKAQDPVLQTSDRVQAVVAFVAPTDLRIMVWDAPKSLPAYKRFPALDLDADKASEVSPLAHVTNDDAPTLLIAGDKDTLVPIKHSHDIYAELQKQKVDSKIMVIEGAGHGLEKDRDKAMREMVAWFEKHLAP